jgi:hypothetical protein
VPVSAGSWATGAACLGSRQQSQVPRYNRQVQRLHGWRGTGSPSPDISPEIGHQIILENDRYESFFLSDTYWWTTGKTPIGAGGAGTFAQVQVENPAGSGLLCVITRAVVYPIGTQGEFDLTLDGALAGAPTANLALDTRVKAIGTKNRILNSGAGVSGTILDLINLPEITEEASFHVPGIVLLPGHRVSIFNATANIGFTGLLLGYERPLEQSEQS